MKTKQHAKLISLEPTEDDIRDYAHHLYIQNGSIPGRDLENWLEAKACLEACIPKSKSQIRLHHHTRNRTRTVVTAMSPEARNLAQ
ncbi:MAG: DUF2934 domain-containing protein [Opitutaceae bacterium]|jgi:hypothetical protein